MKKFLKKFITSKEVDDISIANNYFLSPRSIVEKFGKEYTYFLVSGSVYFELISSYRKPFEGSRTSDGYPFFSYFGYIFQWLPVEEANKFNVLA